LDTLSLHDALPIFDNLLDRHYQDPIGFLRPGLGVFAGLRVAFDTAARMR
jgi:hypothetical protein